MQHAAVLLTIIPLLQTCAFATANLTIKQALFAETQTRFEKNVYDFAFTELFLSMTHSRPVMQLDHSNSGHRITW